MLKLKSIFNHIIFVVVFFILPLCCESQRIDYRDLQILGATCPGRDSCNDGRIDRNFTMRNCECDSRCNIYKDCCIDAISSTRSRAASTYDRQLSYSKCIVDRGSPTPSGVYAISKCKRGWTGSTLIRRNCESNHNNISDPLLATPVMDPIHRKTYRNLYCAECNDENILGLSSWQVLIHCKDLRDVSTDYIRENLVYSNRARHWGINYKNSSMRTPKFHECKLAFGLPRNSEQYVRRCRPNIVKTCASGWSRPDVATKCESYTAVVYTDETAYRNPHCAMCNNVNLDEIKCQHPDMLIIGRNRSPMSFTLLLDANLRDGSCVGRVGEDCRCANGQQWDPFFKKCRSRSCSLPGFTMLNGRCVRQ